MTGQSGDRRFLIGLLVFAAILRGGVLIGLRSRLNEDPDAYFAIAEQIQTGQGFSHPQTGKPTAYRPPLYPILVSAVLKTEKGRIAIAHLQWVLGLLTVWLTWQLGLKLSGTRVAKWAACLIAFDPLLLLYSTQVMTETLCAFLAVAALRLLVPYPEHPGRQIIAGVLLGLCVLSRPTFLVFLGLGLLIQTVYLIRSGRMNRLPVLLGLSAIVTVSPWVVRNYNVFQEFRLTTTHGGYTVLLGNNPVFYWEVVRAPWGTVWQKDSLLSWQQNLEWELGQEFPSASEAERDRWMTERAINVIRQDPQGFAKATFLRFLRFWNVDPPATALSAAGNFWRTAYRKLGIDELETLTRPVVFGLRATVIAYYGLLIMGVVLAIVRFKKPEWTLWWPVVLLVGSFCAVHLVYWSNTRMRAPVMPAIALLAAWGLSKRSTDSTANIT